jgi:hypothetical protein
MSNDDQRSVTLPSDPSGSDFEDFICAHIQGAGFYTDRSVTERGDAEILEIDVITTEYAKESRPEQVLYEAKSGGWGFGDIFKVKGWMSYLNMPRGVFIAKNRIDHADYYAEKARELGIQLMIIDELAEMPNRLADALGWSPIEASVRDIWRFAFLTERKTLALLKKRKKENLQRECYRAIDQYLFTINSRIFFSPNALDRVARLYEAFKNTPNLSAKCINELKGNDFAEECTVVDKETFGDCYYRGKINDLALTTYVEHRSRLAILKSAVDFLLYKQSGDTVKAEKPMVIAIGGVRHEFSTICMLPQSFREAVDELATEPYFYRYPVVWQWFMLFFGGFLLTDRLDEEYALIGRMTGIPPADVPKALAWYDKLFPLGGGGDWFFDGYNSKFKSLHLFPIQFSGIGAIARRALVGEGKEYNELGLTGQYTAKDMTRWHNAAISIHHV